jgi:hypothetical protein
MKKTFIINAPIAYFTLIIFIFQLVSCEKKRCNNGIQNRNEVDVDCGGKCQPCLIKYPSTGTFGENLLYGSDTLWLTNMNYSFRAIVPKGGSLKIELNLISGSQWAHTLGSNVGWSISAYNNGQQTFEVLNPGISDVNIFNDIESGRNIVLVKFFENSETETRRRIIVFN